jgi:hypothetical protein
MRLRHGVLLASALLIPSSLSSAATPPTSARSAFRLQVVTDAGEANGTCALIHRDDRNADVVLTFVTASRLFKGADDTAPPRIQSVRVWLDGGRALDVRRNDVFLPAAMLVDIAVFRATTPPAAIIVALPPVYDAPSAGDAFAISGVGSDGAAATVAERVQFQSTILTVGDRDASALIGCVGAPAIFRSGVFGIVSECAAGHAPVIAQLSIARSFIERHVPRSAPGRP